jgi:mono/diheme cytochrome c family protein
MRAPRESLIIALILGALLAACPAKEEGSAPEPQKRAQTAPPPVAPTPTSTRAAQAASPLDQGKKLFMTGCMNCHGPDGTGALMRAMLPNIGDLSSPELHARLKDDDIEKMIMNGKDKMPPFKDVFKPDQIKLIVSYVRTLKK